MDWRDHGTIISARRHGETAAIVEVFTEHHGRHAGVVRGGASRKQTPVLQPGNRVDVEWRARLEDHLGTFRIEPVRSRAAILMGDRMALAGLGAMVSLLRVSMPEREAHPRIYRASEALFDAFLGAGWAPDYLAWELLLLEDLGFGLDLGSCAATGARDGLAFVSPKTGRAVSREAAGEWAARLLPFPDPASPASVAEGLRTTGWFLEHWMAPALGIDGLPEARSRLLDLMNKRKAPT